MKRSHGALAASILLSFTLGSIHAFSLFVAPLETALASGRAEVSLVYSLALVSLTAAVLLGHRLFHRLAPAGIALLVALVGAGGLLVAALASSLWLVLLGYGVLFGGANGLGYGFCLQMAGRAVPARAGLAMGLVTAVYALGATAFASLFDLLIARGGAPLGFVALALALTATGVLCAFLFRRSGLAAADDRAVAAAADIPFDRLFWALWGGYGLAVAAGLMALGHAAGIAAAAGGSPRQVLAGAMLVGLGNAAGGFAVAAVADRLSPGRLLTVLPLLSAAALAFQALAPGAFSALVALTLIGAAYGAIIAVTPYAVARTYGPERYARAYGRIFTAWGLAGLVAPSCAGLLYDLAESYRAALLVAALAAALAAGVAARLPASAPTPR